MNRRETLRDKVFGCILGGAIGDCMGGPHEGAAIEVTPRRSGRWRLSDDTQMTLATCAAISESGRVDPAAIASTFAKWFERRRITGTGASTRKALIELSAGAHWALAGRGGEMAHGNGAAMRAAPLAFHLDPERPDDRRAIRDVCRITHRSDEAYAGALAVIMSIRAALAGRLQPGETFLSLASRQLPDTSLRDRIRELVRLEGTISIKDLAEQFGASGYVVESVPLALFAASLIWTGGFEDILDSVVACGGDADTNASIAGQIMGAVIGYAAIPSEMTSRLPELNILTDIVDRFFDSIDY